MPGTEEIMSSKAWLKRYSLKRQLLDIDSFIKEVTLVCVFRNLFQVPTVRHGPQAKQSGRHGWQS